MNFLASKHLYPLFPSPQLLLFKIKWMTAQSLRKLI
jgi:hypothetical protein